MICTFFGHRDTPRKIEPLLRAALEDLIANKRATVFYVGNNGSFDSMAIGLLKELKIKYPHIQYFIVLAYFPREKDRLAKYTDTLYPDGLESIPPRYAISKRNEWMVNHADFVVSYVKYHTGGAAHFKNMAEKKGKTIIDLAK